MRQRLQLLQRIAEPLAFAHSRGIIHRDLKPGNIMVGAFGEVLIMDWGLAKVMAATSEDHATVQIEEDSASQHSPGKPSKDESSSAGATVHGTVLGTPGYMAPEQERGEVKLIDHRTDVFGLGSILKYMMRDDRSVTHSELAPRPLRAICNKAMAAEMSARYASVQDMAADIGKYLDDMPVSAYRENIIERTVRLVNRNRVAVVLVLAYLLMRTLFILFSRH